MPSERDDGQMMLLAAVVLIVAFLALTVLVARIGIVESEIGRDAANTLLLEANVLPQGVCSAMWGSGSSDLNSTLDLLGTQLVARGILPKWTVHTAADNAANVTVSLTDGRSRLAINVRETVECQNL